MSDPARHGAARDADLLIVGAGIAGASAAWFAARAGRRPLVIDAASVGDGTCASSVPSALINPVRGYQGRVAPRGVDGARFTFALIDRLIADGHRIDHGRGLWRPAPDAQTRARWAAQLPPDFTHHWQDHVPAEAGLAGHWTAALYLPDSGWVDSRALLDALLLASGAQRLHAVVRDMVPDVNGAGATVVLDNGDRIAARELLWCGGASGAARMRYAALYRPGSVITTEAHMSDVAVSHGLYCAPCGSSEGAGSAIGPTHEPSRDSYPREPATPEVLAQMLERAGQMFARPLKVRSRWHGVRLARVTMPPGIAHLTGLGSRGFLMGPLLAAGIAQARWGLAATW